jgi:hypothetical protein
MNLLRMVSRLGDMFWRLSGGWNLDLEGEKISNGDLGLVALFTSIERLNLGGTNVSDVSPLAKLWTCPQF